MKKTLAVLMIILMIVTIFSSCCVSKASASESQGEDLCGVLDYGNNFYLVYLKSRGYENYDSMSALGETISRLIDENPGMTLSSMTPFTYGYGYSGGDVLGYYLYFTKNTDVVNN
ncbi:MAG: hypothetical protein PHG24_02415 [Candidatus Pacebacteria bacterium]|nr:hypothetical protein [Candidatus Paceibacterota bacterium]